MRVIIYVEGPSDKLAMESLLEPLIASKMAQGTSIAFFEAPPGDKKKSVLEKVPVRAVNILRNDPQTVVVAMPDLYPRHKGFPHETPQQLFEGIRQNFENELQRKGIDDPRLGQRFHVFCFKHDLEALVLASEEALRERLGASSLKITWTLPVEDQDQNHPPKHVVANLFEAHGERYQETIDTPLILSMSRFDEIAARCS